MKLQSELHKKVLEVLHNVKDPEIDSVSVIDLGMIERVEVEDGRVQIEALPTFVGCPALDIIRNNMEKAIYQLPQVQRVEVRFIYDPPWTSDRVTERGRERLKEFGIAPPPKYLEKDGLWKVDCPYCGSPYTTMENLFGPTACRSILYCKSCKNPFEAMKPVSTMM
ncbi:MAG TPA: 1,2-phenylacetyl-CoA epoxidase subunit PaaD [Bacillus sp. (in: firmicutes)]|uniref:1,2-phenylacetyl-CoA epoxidase subunit PaaD n=1 Tax=Bacillus litorisediminis TaxID=2922713 RepID=UPI001FADEF2D|nr:1,2-phenylacetyl-CoA epoxidase subunit PaaD [Bacillus litorisediminis]HWO78343.1 1,2-phenylacetyl-CoA epoxidase subunit PaaD [Bacillus sp. (in: firmicutes)]